MAHTLHAPLIWPTERPSGTVTLQLSPLAVLCVSWYLCNHGTNLRPAILGGSLSIPCAGRGMGGLFVAHVHNSWGGTEQERRWFAGTAVQQHDSQLFLVDNIFCLDGSAND